MSPFCGDFFQSVLDDIQEYVFMVDEAYRIVYVNRGACRNIFNGENVLHNDLFETFPGLTTENSNIVSVFRTGEPVLQKITNYIDNDGKRRVALTSDYPVKENGKIVGVYEISEDITGLSRMSERVVEESSQYATGVKRPAKNKRTLYTLGDFIGESPAARQLRQRAALYAASASNLMIYGETGTGKEILTQGIYSLGQTGRNAPFVAQNCAAIPEALLEGLLFGTVKGAFTGAETKPGLFELANGGMMFLDEVNSMPPYLQAKILRVLEEGKVRRVGGDEEIDVDFRLISSTNVSPESMMENGQMRQDLFFRLNVLYIQIPPLRERREDIPTLLSHYVERYNRKLGKKIVGFDEKLMDSLIAYGWPGNVRELKNMVERALHSAQGRLVSRSDVQFDACAMLKKEPPRLGPPESRVRLKEALGALERELIAAALTKCGGNVSRAARELDIPQQTLHSKMSRYGISRS